MELDSGIYIVTKKKKEVYDFFIKKIVSGRKGIWITQGNPLEIKSRYGLISTTIISLSEYIVSVDGKKRIEGSLAELLDQFVERYSNNVIILIEDVEEVMKDSLSSIMDLMKIVSARFLTSNMIFVLLVDGTQDEVKMKILEKDYGFIRI